jgi:hypothetical protein
MTGTNFYTFMPEQSANHYAGLVDENGYVLIGKFDTASIPDTTANVFQKGCTMIKTDAGNGVSAIYENTGTLAAPAWSLIPATGSGITELTGDVTAGPGSGTQAATIANGAVIAAKIATAAVTTAKISDGNVTIAKLEAGVQPQSIVKFAAQYTTGGGAAAEAITVTGALSTDLAFVQLVNPGSNTVSVVSAVITADTLTITFSGDPGADAVINYQITRVAT